MSPFNTDHSEEEIDKSNADFGIDPVLMVDLIGQFLGMLVRTYVGEPLEPVPPEVAQVRGMDERVRQPDGVCDDTVDSLLALAAGHKKGHFPKNRTDCVEWLAGPNNRRIRRTTT